MPYEALSGSDCSKSSHSEVDLVYDFKLSFDTAIPGNGCFGPPRQNFLIPLLKNTCCVSHPNYVSFRQCAVFQSHKDSFDYRAKVFTGQSDRLFA